MKPINFPGCNAKIAEHQDEYLTLPAFVNERETISCWELTEEEIDTIKRTRKLWVRMMNFRKPLQPIQFSVIPQVKMEEG